MVSGSSQVAGWLDVFESRTRDSQSESTFDQCLVCRPILPTQWTTGRTCIRRGKSSTQFCLERVEQHSSGRVQALESGRLALSEGSRVSRLPSGSRRLPFSIPAESSDLPVKRVFRDITALRLSKFPVPAVSVQVFVCLGEGQPGLVSWTC